MRQATRPVRVDRWKALWTIAMVSFFGGGAYSVIGGDEAAIATADAASGGESAPAGEGTHGDANPGESKRAEAPAQDPVVRRTAEGCLADSATLDDLKRQKRELEARQRELSAREAELKAREQALMDEMQKLSAARDEIARIDGDRKKEDEAKVAKLVETIESMNPKSAAALVASIDDGLAVQAMTRLTTPKLAKIMNVMDPARSTKLSELLAGVTRARKSKPASNPVATTEDAAAVTAERARGQSAERSPAPAKGGEQYDGKSHEQANNRSSADEGARKPASLGSVQKGGESAKR